LRFIDTNVFIYVLNSDPDFGPTAKRILQRIEEGEETVTSTLVAAEVAAWLEFNKRKHAIPPFFMSLESYPSLTKIETTYSDELTANKLVTRYPQLRFFDRVYLAQMERTGLKEIYSNDKGFDKVAEVSRVFK
jgi:uncharacterized protein